MQNAIIVTRQNDLKEGENISSKTLELRSKYKPKYNITNYFEFGIDDNTNDSDHNIIFSHIHQNNVDNIIVSDFSQISGKISNIMSFVEYCNKQKINIIIDNYKLDTLNKDKSVNSIVQKILNVGADLAFLEKEFFQKKLNNGRAKYIRKGGLLGRKSGSRETKATFLSKHNDIISLLKQNMSIRKIMNYTGKSSGTVQKVKRYIQPKQKNSKREISILSIKKEKLPSKTKTQKNQIVKKREIVQLNPIFKHKK